MVTEGLDVRNQEGEVSAYLLLTGSSISASPSLFPPEGSCTFEEHPQPRPCGTPSRGPRPCSPLTGCHFKGSCFVTTDQSLTCSLVFSVYCVPRNLHTASRLLLQLFILNSAEEQKAVEKLLFITSLPGNF